MQYIYCYICLCVSHDTQQTALHTVLHPESVQVICLLFHLQSEHFFLKLNIKYISIKRYLTSICWIILHIGCRHLKCGEHMKIAYFFFSFLSLFYQGHPHSIWRFPGRRVESELQLLAYATATATPDLSHIWDLHHSSGQCQILNPLSDARDQTCILMDTSWICFCSATMGIPFSLFFKIYWSMVVYNVLLASGVQQSESGIHINIPILFSIQVITDY